TNIQANNSLINKMREQISRMYSAKVREQLSQKEKPNFFKELKYYEDCLHRLEIQNLETILAKMKPLKAELNRAITSLDNALANISNMVNILSNIQSVTNIITRILPVV
ncbi:MAG: hypothetical protein AAF378_17835, partial [Cyanobacteria bacterium P01_A01_bin.84]